MAELGSAYGNSINKIKTQNIEVFSTVFYILCHWSAHTDIQKESIKQLRLGSNDETFLYLWLFIPSYVPVILGSLDSSNNRAVNKCNKYFIMNYIIHDRQTTATCRKIKPLIISLLSILL